MFIDTHAHLFYDNFAGELDQVIASAKENNVDVIIVPATDLETSKKVIELTETYDIIYGAVGVHPHETKNWENSFLKKLKEFAQHKKIRSEEHTSELQSHHDLVCRLLREKTKRWWRTPSGPVWPRSWAQSRRRCSTASAHLARAGRRPALTRA